VPENVTYQSLQKLSRATKDAVAIVTKESRNGFCRRTETVENKIGKEMG
jgi:hypothetical protein